LAATRCRLRIGHAIRVAFAAMPTSRRAPRGISLADSGGMKWVVIIALLVATEARADVFEFKDAAGFAKCMQLDHLIEHTNTRDGSQTRVLVQEDIQPRCIAAAVRLAARTKDRPLATECVAITKRETAPEMALDLIGVVVDLALPACNDMDNYEVLVRPLSQGHEAAEPKAKATAIIKRCLRDSSFRKDFVDEKDSGDEARARNACRILLDEKLVKSCKGGK
jgi:hypothetical protein